MRIVASMDSFKGSLSSSKAGKAVSEGALRAGESCEVFLLADGGEGTSEAITEGYEAKTLAVSGPLGDQVSARYFVKDGRAVLDIAECSGLTLVKKRDILNSSTFGLGELLGTVIGEGVRDITLCLGGSATGDCGAGMLEALGAVFLDGSGRRLTGRPSDLLELAICDLTAVRELIDGVTIRALCDVTNPLMGRNGAAFVFAPQKGASASDIVLLEKTAGIFSSVVTPGLDTGVPGFGAAGGLGYCLSAVLGASLVPGAPFVIGCTGLVKRLGPDVDIFITGEGRADKTSLGGKAAYEACRAARSAGVKHVFVIAGSSDITAEEFGCDRILTLPDTEDKMEEAVAVRNITTAAFEIVSALKG